MRRPVGHTRAGFAAFVLLAISAGSAAATPILFRTARTFGPASTQSVTAPGDFDGDLDPDIAVIRSAGTLEWWSNSGGALSGPFAIATPILLRHDLIAGDLDGDGRADLVGCDEASVGGAVAVFHSNGAGFDPAALVPTDSAGIRSLALADLDGDLDLDLVATNRFTRKVHRLFNDGAGNFSGLASTVISGEPSRTWVADLNGDGRADLLVGQWPGVMMGQGFGGAQGAARTMLGTGGGAFAAPIPSQTRGVVALGAFSAPGAHDAYVSDSLGIGIAHGQGDGTFEPPVFTPGILTSCWQAFAQPIDIDGDGRDEIIASNGGCTPGGAVTFRVDGSSSIVHRESHSGDFFRSGSIADLNGDGRADVVGTGLLVATSRDGRLGGTRTLPPYEAIGLNLGDVKQVAGADLDGNGAADIVMNIGSGLGAIWLSNHDGTFQTGFEWQSNTYSPQAEFADMDGDGDLDIIERHNDSGITNHLYIWINDGTGHRASVKTATCPFTGSQGLVIADFDADGDADVLTTGRTSFTSLVPYLFLNDGPGQLTVSPCAPPFGVYGKVGGDPLPALCSTAGDSIQLERAIATCTLAPPTRTWAGGTLVSARFADVNGDGLTDAVCLLAGGQVNTLLGEPGGAWSAPIPSAGSAIAPGYSAVFANVGDLEGDGKPDLLFTGSGAPNAISVMRNLGGGAFGERGDSFTNQSFGTAIADVDGDGAGDLLGIEPHPAGQLSTKMPNILYGMTDASTPVLASLVSATASIDGARLQWWVSSDGPATLDLERRRAGGTWSPIASLNAVGGSVVYQDRAVEAGATYEWRLSWSEDGARHYSDIARLTIAARASFAMAGMRPNPVDGDRVRIELSLEKLDPVEVRIADLAGRVLAVRRFEPAAGARDFVVDGLGDLPAGLYFVRASQGSQHVSRMLVRVR